MWSVKLRLIWRILLFKRRWYNESTLNRKQLKGQIGLINLKVIPLPQMVCNIQIIIIKKKSGADLQSFWPLLILLNEGANFFNFSYDLSMPNLDISAMEIIFSHQPV